MIVFCLSKSVLITRAASDDCTGQELDLALVFRCVIAFPVPMWAAAVHWSFGPCTSTCPDDGGSGIWGSFSPHLAAPLKSFFPPSILILPLKLQQAASLLSLLSQLLHSSPQTCPHQLLPLCPDTCLDLLILVLWKCDFLSSTGVHLSWRASFLLQTSEHCWVLHCCGCNRALDPSVLLVQCKVCLPSTHHLPLMAV